MLIEGRFSRRASHYCGNYTAAKYNPLLRHQRCVGVMGDHQNQLVLTAKQLQCPLLIDPGIFDLVNKYDGAVANEGDIPDISALDCPPLS